MSADKSLVTDLATMSGNVAELGYQGLLVLQATFCQSRCHVDRLVNEIPQPKIHCGVCAPSVSLYVTGYGA